MRRLAKESLLGRGGSPGLEPRGLEPSKHRGRGNSHHRVRNEVPGPGRLASLLPCGEMGAEDNSLDTGLEVMEPGLVDLGGL